MNSATRLSPMEGASGSAWVKVRTKLPEASGQPLAADVQHALKAAEFALEWERKGGSPRGPVVGGLLSPVAAIDFGTK